MPTLAQACDQMDGEGELDDFGGNMDAVNDPAHAEKIFFEYLSKAYAVFLAGDDNYDTMDSELISSFGELRRVLVAVELRLISQQYPDRKNDLIIRQIERLTADNEAFAAELRNLNDGEDPLLTLSKERESLQHDKENFQTYKAHLENKKAKAAEAVRRVKDDVARTGWFLRISNVAAGGLTNVLCGGEKNKT